MRMGITTFACQRLTEAVLTDSARFEEKCVPLSANALFFSTKFAALAASLWPYVMCPSRSGPHQSA